MPVSFRLAAFYCAFFAWVGIVTAYFPPYLAERGLDAAQIAWVLALPPLARILAPAAWGWIADRTRAERGIVVLSCATGAACFALLPVVDGFAGIAWLIALSAAFSAAALPLVEAITLGALAGQSGRYGPIRLWGSIGFIGVVLAGGVWLDSGLARVLPPAVVMCALAAAGAGLSLPKRAVHPASAAASPRMTSSALALLASAFCVAVSHGTLYTFLTLHLRALGYSGTLIGFLWTLGVLAEIVVFFYLPALFRRYALSTILMASAALGVLRFQIIGWAADWLVLLLLAQVLHAATFGSYHAAAVAAVQRIFPPHARSRGQALFSSLGYGAGGAAGALSAGWAWHLAGPGLAFTVSSIAAGAGLLFAYPLKREGL
ncbi:MAG TPA: MFS transporter [Burkholderiales bacterium]|nr:MFS transporter [Burkholderiales bacterium]